MATVFELADVRSLILDILSRRNWFDSKQFDEIEEQFEKASPGTSPEMFLIKGGYISDQEIASLYAEDLFLPLVPNNIEAGPIDKELASLLPEKLCVDKLICPMAVRDDVLDVAFVSPEEMGVVDELQLLTGLRINPMIAPLSVVQARIDALYRADQQTKGIGEGGEFDVIEEDRATRTRTRTSSTSTCRPRRTPTAGSSAWSIRSSSRPCATAPATSTSSRSRTAASSASGSTACSTSCRRRRRPCSS